MHTYGVDLCVSVNCLIACRNRSSHTINTPRHELWQPESTIHKRPMSAVPVVSSRSNSPVLRYIISLES